MQSVSQTWQDIYDASGGNPHIETRATINSTVYTDIGQPVITRSSMQNGISVGNVVSACCLMAIRTSDTIPKSASVVIENRLVGGTDDSPVYSEWLPAGTFYISKRSRDPVTGILTLESYDALLMANSYMPAQSAGYWPRAMASLASDIATAMGVTIDSRSTIATGAIYVVNEPAAGTAMRDLLGIIAAANGGNWIMTPDNKLRLVPILDAADAEEATDDVFTVPYVLGSVYVGDAAEITGIRYTAGEALPVLIGDETGIVLDVSMSYGLADALATQLIGMTYQPFSLGRAIYNPAAEIGDYIVREDSFGSVLYSETVTLGGGYISDCVAPDPAEIADEYPYPGASEKALMQAKAYTVETVDSAIDDYDTSLNQQTVFNKLTNNGVEQGIYLYNGKIYINANYIAAHTISAAKLTGSITGGLSNSWVLDFDNGTFTIGNISAANITTGTLSADRIAANSIAVGKLTGSISATATGCSTAWSLDLSNNGTLTIGDINANSIKAGTISADRIAANSIAVGKLTGSISATATGGSTAWEVNLTNGTLTIGDINANSIKAGTLSANFISGGTLTLGGNNEQYGTIRVLNSLGNEAGRWTSSSLYAGSIRANHDLTIGQGTISLANPDGVWIAVSDNEIEFNSNDSGGSTLDGIARIYATRSLLTIAGTRYPISLKLTIDDNNVFKVTHDIDGDVLTAKIETGTFGTRKVVDISGNLSVSGGTLTTNSTNGIAYQGTKATYNMIRFVDNTTDTYGNGIVIGGGGATIIGGGESTDKAIAELTTGGSEIMYICNDGDVQIHTNLQTDWASRKTFTFSANGNLTVPGEIQASGCVRAIKAGETYVEAQNSTTGARVLLDSSSSYHGLWSNGYWNGSSFVSSAIWMLYRNTDSNIVMPRLTSLGNASGVYNVSAPTFMFLRGEQYKTDNKIGAIFANTQAVNSKNVCLQMYFRHYSYNSSTGDPIEHWDQYRLPAATADKTGDNTYDILTTKNMGFSITGNATTATTSTNLSVPRVNKNVNEHPGKNVFRAQEFVNTSANLPSSHYYYIYEGQGADTAYSTQLAIGETIEAMYYRSIKNNTYGSWARVIDSNIFDAVKGSGSDDQVAYLKFKGKLNSTEKTFLLIIYSGTGSNNRKLQLYDNDAGSVVWRI